MPIPISHLFGEEDDPLIHRLPNDKDIRDMSKGWPNLPVKLEDFPNVDPPEPESKRHKEDLNILKSYFFRPVNSEKFLEISDEKPFQLFKRYVNDNGLDIDLEKLDNLNEELASLICNLKFKYNRPRPRNYMERHHSDFPYERIDPNKSPSYPSGHTAHAFFNACMISNLFPAHEMRLRTLAEMIAQSRIDLGKHYPTDVSFGRFIGEHVAKCVKDKLGEKIGDPVYLNSPSDRDKDPLFSFAEIKLTPSGEGNAFKLKIVDDHSNGTVNELYEVESSFDIKVVSVKSINGANKFIIDGNIRRGVS